MKFQRACLTTSHYYRHAMNWGDRYGYWRCQHCDCENCTLDRQELGLERCKDRSCDACKKMRAAKYGEET